MLALQLFSVILALQLVQYLSSVEDKFFIDWPMEYFDDTEIKNGLVKNGFKKREALEAAIGSNKPASIIRQSLMRASHYWTRKRGHEKYTTPAASWGIPQWYYAGRSRPYYIRAKRAI